MFSLPSGNAASSTSTNHADDAGQPRPEDVEEDGTPKDTDEEASDDINVEMPRPAFASSDQWGRVPEGAWQVNDDLEDSDTADGHLDQQAKSQLQQLQQQLKGLCRALPIFATLRPKVRVPAGCKAPQQLPTGELMLRWFEELPDPASQQQQLIPWAPLVQHDMQLPMQSGP